MNELTLIKIRNPFSRTDRDIVPAPYLRDQTLLALRAEHFPDVRVTVSINGRIVPEADLGRTYPLPGDQILFVPVLEGGDDGMRMVLMIIVAVVATYVAGPLGVGTWQYALAAGTIMLIGGMLVNGILPPPQPDLPGSTDISQAYSWSPQTTQRQGIPIPKWYGVNKLYGNVIAAYLSGDGEKQYINALIGLGIGPMKRLYEFGINDQPASSFQGVNLYARLGHINQTVTDPFNDTKVEYPLSVKVVKPTEYVYTTIGDSFDGLEIEIAFPNGLWYSNDSGGFDRLSVSFRISVRRQGSSTWNSITHQTGAALNSAVGYWSLGYWNQDSDEGTAIGPVYWVELYHGGTGVYDHIEGAHYDFVYDNEYPDDWFVRLCGRWRWIGDVITVAGTVQDFVTVTAGQISPIKKTYSLNSLERGRYEIKFENMSDDQTSTRYGDDLYVSAVREILYDDFEYPRLTLSAVKALATDQLSGSLRFSCMGECSYIRVYNGTSWIYAASDNIAWCSWDALTKPVIETVKCKSLQSGYDYFDATVSLSFRTARYDGENPSKLDLVAWKSWADYCDDLVPDGNGGTEKRFTFNGGFDSTTSTWEAAQQIAQLGRATIVPTGDGYTVAVDRPGTPVQMFTVGNIGINSFKETFLRKADRASSVNLQFVNRDKNYERDTFTVQLPGISSPNSASMSLFGCTKPSEAWRHGMYRLYNNLYISRAAELNVGIDGIACSKGDLINIQHDVPQWGYGGRLVTATTSSVTIDKTVTIESGKTYTIMIRLMDDTVVSRSITNAPGTYSVLTVSSPFSTVPQQYDIYAFGETGMVVKPFRVLNIKKDGDQECTLSLIEYNESVYNADTLQPALPTPNYSSIDALPPVTGILLDELLIARQDGTIDDVIDVYFTRPASSLYLRAEIWYNNGSGWKLAGETISDHLRIAGVEISKTYIIAIVTVNSAGLKQKIQNAPQASMTTLGKLDPPSNVTNFAASQNGQFINFSWTHIPDADLWAYEIRQGTTWESGRVIVVGESSDKHAWQAELNGTYRFLIKAIDSSNIYSVLATSVDISLTNIDENLNVVLSQDEITKSGGPDGTKTNMVFLPSIPALAFPGGLTFSDVSSSTYGDLSDIPWGSVSGQYETLVIDTFHVGDTWVRIIEEKYAADPNASFGSYPDRTWGDFIADTYASVTMPASTEIYLSYSSDGSSYSAWELYTGTVQRSFRYIKIKYTVNNVSNRGIFRLLHLALTFDVPEIRYVIQNFTVAAATGSNISYGTYGLTFYSTPIVWAQLVGGALNNVVPDISAKTSSGCHIDAIDRLNARVAANFDVHLLGY